MNIQDVLKRADREYRRQAIVDTSKMNPAAKARLEQDIPMIEQYLLDLRRILDPTQKDPDYPNGYCKIITDYVFKRLKKERYIQEFQRRGIVFKKLWGITGGTFQNAMQLGHLYLNAAGDTVNTENAPARVVKLEEADFREIQTYEDYLTVARNYWHFDAVPNYVFPLISGFLPHIFTNGDTAFFYDRHIGPLLAKDIRADFQGAERVLFQTLKEKKLTPKQLEFLLGSLQPEFEATLARCPQVDYYFQPHVPEEMEREFKIMKALWNTEPTTPGRIYAMVHSVFKNKVFEKK